MGLPDMGLSLSQPSKAEQQLRFLEPQLEPRNSTRPGWAWAVEDDASTSPPPGAQSSSLPQLMCHNYLLSAQTNVAAGESDTGSR